MGGYASMFMKFKVSLPHTRPICRRAPDCNLVRVYHYFPSPSTRCISKHNTELVPRFTRNSAAGTLSSFILPSRCLYCVLPAWPDNMHLFCETHAPVHAIAAADVVVQNPCLNPSWAKCFLSSSSPHRWTPLLLSVLSCIHENAPAHASPTT